MPRTWGYIIIVAAIVVGAAALLLPVPESVEVQPVEAPKPEPAAHAPTPAAPPRAAHKAQPTPPPERNPPAAVTGLRPVPMQDTTKTRQLVQPKPPAK
jgi:hypothetical protein